MAARSRSVVTRGQAVFTVHCIDEMAQFAIIFVPSSDSGASTATFANLIFECHAGLEGRITEIIEDFSHTSAPAASYPLTCTVT